MGEAPHPGPRLCPPPASLKPCNPTLYSLPPAPETGRRARGSREPAQRASRAVRSASGLPARGAAMATLAGPTGRREPGWRGAQVGSRDPGRKPEPGQEERPTLEYQGRPHKASGVAPQGARPGAFLVKWSRDLNPHL